jgi:hypothetical protein
MLISHFVLFSEAGYGIEVALVKPVPKNPQFDAGLFPLTPALKKLQLAACRCCHQITEVDQTRILFKIYFGNKK